MPRLLAAASIVLSLSASLHSFGGPLEQAEVTKIINHVSVVDPHQGERAAALRDVIKDDLGLETGTKSRSELLFQDNTLTRLGAETFFSFKTGTRDMTLEKGSMLLQVPKGLGGATIHTAAVTAAITGTTIMMEYKPNQYIKVLVLEGSLRLSRNGSFGDSLILRPGKMVIMRPDAKRIPDPVDVDLAHLVKTSTLVNFPGTPLPSMPLIQEAIDVQQGQLATKDLAPTNLVMGGGTKVTIVPGNPLAAPTTALGVVGTGPHSPVTGITGATASVLPTLGGLTTSVNGVVGDVLTSTTGTTTNPVGGVLGATTGTVGTLTNDLLGGATGAVNGLTSNVLGSTTGALDSVTSVLLTSTTRTLDTVTGNVLGSANATVNAVTTNVLSTTSALSSVAVNSSTQILSLLNNATQSTSGLVTIVPTVGNVVTPATSIPATSGATTAVANTVGTVTGATSALTGAVSNVTSTLLSSGPTPTVTSTTTVPVSTSPTNVVSAVTSLPPTLLTGTTSATKSLLGLGH